MSLPNAQNSIRELIAQRAADRALVDTLVADESALRGSAESMLTSDFNLRAGHLRGSIDIPAILASLQGTTARMLSVFYHNYTNICNDMINVLRDPGPNGVQSKAAKFRRSNANNLRTIQTDLALVKADIQSEYSSVIYEFRNSVLQMEVFRNLRGADAQLAQLTTIITNLTDNLVAAGHDLGTNRNDNVRDLFTASEIQDLDNLLVEYVEDHNKLTEELTYDKFFDYFQKLREVVLFDLEKMLEFYDNATNLGRTPAETVSLNNMQNLEERLCQVFSECIVRIFGNNRGVHDAFHPGGAYDPALSFAELRNRMSRLSPPLNVDDAAILGPRPRARVVEPGLLEFKRFVERTAKTENVTTAMGLPTFRKAFKGLSDSKQSEILRTLQRYKTNLPAVDIVDAAEMTRIITGAGKESIGATSIDALITAITGGGGPPGRRRPRRRGGP